MINLSIFHKYSLNILVDRLRTFNLIFFYLLFSLISGLVTAQKTTDYFPVKPDKKYFYRFLEPGSDFLNQWQVSASGNCKTDNPEIQCIKIEMKSLAGTVLENGKKKVMKEKRYDYEIGLEMSESFVNLRKWNVYENIDETVKSEVWTTELPLIKIPDTGKILTQTADDKNSNVKITFEIIPVFTIKNKKYQNVLLTTLLLTDKKSGKPSGKKRFYFGKNVGLLRFESYNAENQLDLKQSFELEKSS